MIDPRPRNTILQLLLNLWFVYNNINLVRFQRMALVGLLQRTGLDPALVDYVCVGTVIQEVMLNWI